MSETSKNIFERMKNNLPDNGASAIEGTFTGNNLLAVSNELGRIYSQDIDTLLPRGFALTASGEDLDRVGSDEGIFRKEATYAETIVTISGTPGRYSGIWVGADNIRFLLDDFVIGTSGTADVRAVCQIPGMAGNVPAGTIKEIKTQGSTLDTVINNQAAHGGYEQESDKEYRVRILDKKQKIVTGSNRESYRQWALSVSGVSKAKAIDVFNGPGTVGVYIIANNNIVGDTELLEKVFEYIESVRTVGANVSVMYAEPLQINVTATVVLEEGACIANVKNDFIILLSDYINDFPFIYKRKAIFSFMKTADLLLQADGVADITDIVINGSDSSITLEEIQFPVIGEVMIQEAE